MNKHILKDSAIRYLRFYFKILCIGAPFLLCGQTQYHFSDIPLQEPLPSKVIYALHMDKAGYMWLGTIEGLVRYDGSYLKKFLHHPGDSTSISNNFIHDILEDENGYIWVTTRGGGLNRFDPVTEQFKRFMHDPNDSTSISGNECNRLFIDSDQDLWITTYSAGFNKYLPDTETFLRIPVDTNIQNLREAEALNSAGNIIEDKADKNLLWIGRQKDRLVSYHKISQEITHYPYPKLGSSMSSPVMFNSDEIWVGSWYGGIIKYNKQTKSWATYPTKPLYLEGKTYQQIALQLLEKSPNELWLAEGNIGLAVFDISKKQMISIPGFSDGGKQREFWYRIAYDQDNRLWVANRNGIKTLDPLQQWIHYRSIPLEKHHKKLWSTISEFTSDKLGNLYFAHSGIDTFLKYNISENRMIEIPIILPNNDQQENPIFQMTSVLADSKNGVWATDRYSRSIFRLKSGEKQMTAPFNEALKNVPIPHFSPWDLVEDPNGNIWVGTLYGGLLKIDVQSNTVQQFMQNEADLLGLSKEMLAWRLVLDQSRNCIWIGTMNSGIFGFDLHKERFFKHYPQNPQRNSLLPAGMEFDLELDPQNRLWVAIRGNGISIIDPELPDSESVQSITVYDGLPSNNITDIERDLNGAMWFNSIGALSKYDFTTNTWKHFNEKDGIRETMLDGHNGLTVLANGYLCKGQSWGFHYFHVDSIPTNQKPPKLVFSWFKVLEEEKNFGKSLNHLEQIILPYAQNFFSIGFSALNYTRPEENQYAYQLVGFDSDTVQAGRRNFATYTNVPEGKYTFRVFGCNNDEVWNTAGISIDIIVQPPFYRTTGAYLCYVILGLGLLFTVYRYQKRRLVMGMQLQREKERAADLHTINETKNRLYTNITHEFRTPLTVILGMTASLEEPFGTAKAMIKKNADKLLHLINQMLDLAKLESGHMPLHYRQDNIILYLNYLTYSFQSLANAKHISLSFQPFEPEFNMDFDRDKMGHILSNLLSNALKFTPEYGFVTVKVAKAGTFLVVQVIDTGIGLTEADLPRIFERFQQVDNSSTRDGEGTGIGLALVKELVKLMDGEIAVESEVDQGSVFTVKLPITNKAPLESTAVPLPNPSTSSAETFTKEVPIHPVEELPRLLIIEDNSDILVYFESLLKDHYALFFAKNGIKGAQMAIELVPDIILCDVMMPVKNGFEVTRTLKNHRITNHIPIILLTAKGDQASKELGLQAGADAYLVKPFAREELFIRLQQLRILRDQLRLKYQNYKSEPLKLEDVSKAQELQFLQQFYQVIEDHFQDPDLKVYPHLCQLMAMSKSQLYRKVTSLTGLSPARYLQKTRLDRAQQLLRTTNQPISHIAQQVGIVDASYFTRIYVSQFGETPTETRKKLSSND